MKILAQYTETTPNFTQEWNLVEVMGEELFTCFLKWNGENIVVFIRSLRDMGLYYPLALKELREIASKNKEEPKPCYCFNECKCGNGSWEGMGT